MAGAKLSTTVLVLTLAYVVGVIADEFYDALTTPLERRVIRQVLKNTKEEWNLHAQAILKSPEATASLEYIRSRIRILRSTAIIYPISTALGCLITLLHGPIFGLNAFLSFILVIVFGGSLSTASCFTYNRLTLNYWRRIEKFAKTRIKK